MDARAGRVVRAHRRSGPDEGRRRRHGRGGLFALLEVGRGARRDRGRHARPARLRRVAPAGPSCPSCTSASGSSACSSRWSTRRRSAGSGARACSSALLGIAAGASSSRGPGLRPVSTLALPALWLTVIGHGRDAHDRLLDASPVATFDARQAKRLFPLLTAAAIAGSFVGHPRGGPRDPAAGAESLVVLEAVALADGPAHRRRLVRTAIALDLLRRRRRRARDHSAQLHGRRHARRLRRRRRPRRCCDGSRSPTSCWRSCCSSVTYPFTISASATFPDDAERATALGLLSAAVTATSFLVSVLLANRVYARFGVSAGALVLPVVYLAGFGSSGSSPFSFPTAAAVRFSQQVTQRGLSNASWSAFYNVVPADRRAQVTGLQRRRPGPGRARSWRACCCWPPAGCWPRADLLARGRDGASSAVVVVDRHPPPLRPEPRDGAARLVAAERVLEGGPGVAVLVRDPSVGAALVEALRAPEPGDP